MTNPELTSYFTENFSSKIRKKTRILIITMFINTELEFLAEAIRQEKEWKVI